MRAAARFFLMFLACSCAVAAVNVWHGLFAPRNTPSTVLEKISLDVTTLVKSAEMREPFTGLGVESEGSSPGEFKAYFRKDVGKWRQVVRAARVSADRRSARVAF